MTGEQGLYLVQAEGWRHELAAGPSVHFLLSVAGPTGSDWPGAPFPCLCSRPEVQLHSFTHTPHLACLMPATSSRREYCQQVLRRTAQDCSSYTRSFDTTVFIIESTRRRVAVEATLENRGENAYSAVLNISQSENLQFASLIQKVGPQQLGQLT